MKCDNILKFERIFDYSPIAGVGFAGNIMISINTLLSGNNKLWVDARDTISCDDKSVNSWDVYFNQKYNYKETSNIINSINGYQDVIKYKAKYTHTDDLIIKARSLFYDNFEIKKWILDDVNSYYELNINNKITLACQIRLGDMFKNHNTANINTYENRIKEILIENPEIEQIFLATDDDLAIDYLKDKFTIPIIYQNNIYRESSDDPYKRVFNDRDNHNTNMCKEVLIDIILLGMCKYFLSADVSSVSTVAMVFSKNIEKTYHI